MSSPTWSPPAATIPPPPPFPPGDPRLGVAQPGYGPLPWKQPVAQPWPWQPSVQLQPPAQQPRRSAAAVLAAVVALALVVGLRVVWVTETPHETPAADPIPAAVPVDNRPLAKAPTSGVDFGISPSLATALPKIEAFVEEARGHHFVRPPTVTPLDSKAFLAKLHAGGIRDTRLLDGESATFATLHLVPAGTDLVAALESAEDQAVGGFYDPATKQLYVRGSTLNPLGQVIVVHELTHALDDQYFGVGRLQHQVRDSDQAEALRSLLEGSARSVEDRFRAALVPAQSKRVAAEERAEFGSAASPAPAFLELQLEFPYDVGERFVDYLRAHGGTATLDAAFTRPPLSTLQVMDPAAAYTNRQDPVSGSIAESSSTAVIDRDTLGAFGLGALLSGNDPKTLLHQPAVSSWQGDVYSTTRSGSRVCVVDTIATSGSPAPLADALRAWAAQHPGAAVSVQATRVTLTSCLG